jgi:hypothetical protein
MQEATHVRIVTSATACKKAAAATNAAASEQIEHDEADPIK